MQDVPFLLLLLCVSSLCGCSRKIYNLEGLESISYSQEREVKLPLVDARVADLEFTREWFDQHRLESRNRSVSKGPCDLEEPSIFTGLGYDSTLTEVRNAECWIEQLHSTSRNVDIKGLRASATLVHGPGVSELLFATIVSVAETFAQKPFISSHDDTYYAVLKHVCVSSVLRHAVTWVEPNLVRRGHTTGKPLILVATVPNNPLGTLSMGVLSQCTADDGNLDCFGSPTRVIWDHSFLWPCLTPPQSESDFLWSMALKLKQPTALLFGLSKLSGHSGIRYGWAWITDHALAASVRKSLWEMGTSLSAVAVAHATHVMATIVEGRSFHQWCTREIDTRWNRLRTVEAASTHFRVLSVNRSAVALVHCNSHISCHRLLESVGILSNSGTSSGSGPSTARISLGLSSESFDTLITRLTLINR